MILDLINFLFTKNNSYKAKRCKFLAFLARLFRLEIIKILIRVALPFVITLRIILLLKRCMSFKFLFLEKRCKLCLSKPVLNQRQFHNEYEDLLLEKRCKLCLTKLGN